MTTKTHVTWQQKLQQGITSAHHFLKGGSNERNH